MEDNNKVEFTPEQQEKVNKLIQEAQGRAAKEVKTQLEKTTEELQAMRDRIKELQEQEDKKKTTEPPQELVNKLKEAERLLGTFQNEVASLKNLAKEKETEAAKAMETKRELERLWALEKAAGSERFVDLNLVIKDTKDQVKFDEQYNRYVVLNPDGGVRMNKSMEPMTLTEFYEEYAATKPWVVNPTFKGGAGSSKSSGAGGKYTVEDIFGNKPGAATKAMKLMKEPPEQYRLLRAQAKEQGLL